jgi:molecular chaperone DnaK
MKDAGDKLTEDDKKPVDEAIVKVREVIKSDNIDEIKTALESLNNVWGTIVTKIYPQQTAPNGQQFSAEDMEKMKNNPDFMNQFSQMFGGQTPTGGATSTTDADEAEVVS